MKDIFKLAFTAILLLRIGKIFFDKANWWFFCLNFGLKSDIKCVSFIVLSSICYAISVMIGGYTIFSIIRRLL